MEGSDAHPAVKPIPRDSASPVSDTRHKYKDHRPKRSRRTSSHDRPRSDRHRESKSRSSIPRIGDDNATGSTHCPAETHVNTGHVDEPTPGPSSGEPSLHAVMSAVLAKLDRLDGQSTAHRNSQAHDISGSASDSDEGQCSDSDSCQGSEDAYPFQGLPRHSAADPMAKLSAILAAAGSPNLASASTAGKPDFQKSLVAGLLGLFQGPDDSGPPLRDEFAEALNGALRSRPQDTVIKELAGKIKVPSNVPQLAVPRTNQDVQKALSCDGKLLDSQLSKSNNLLAKALVPLATFVSEYGTAAQKDISAYLPGLQDSFSLITSAFNYVNHTRKEVTRVFVNDSAIAEIAKWDVPVGASEIYPFDVTKKCDEIAKARKLGGPRKLGKAFKQWKPKSSGYRSQFRKHRSARPYDSSSRGYQGPTSKKNDFLAKRPSDRPRGRRQ